MQQIEISKLKPHPRNEEFFDDMTGDAWEAFLESIRTSGVIEPIVVTQDLVIVSGHQRVRGCKALEITEILADMRHYESEDAILKDLIETNIRQRGVGNPNPVKLGRCIKELEKIYGIKQGNNQHVEVSANGTKLTQDALAEQLNISIDVLKRAKALTTLPQEIQDLVEAGNISASTASRLIARLSSSEQEELVSKLDVTQKYTQKQVQQYISQLNSAKAEAERLRNENNRLRNQPQKVQTIEVVPDDYEETKERLAGAKKDYKELHGEYEKMTQKWQSAEQKLRDMEAKTPEQEFNQKLKRETIYFCSGVATFIKENGGYVWIAEHINELPEHERRGYISAVKEVYSWASQMMNNLGITE